MTDYYLKFPSETSMQEALSEFYDSEGNLQSSSLDYAIDVVGTISKESGMLTHDGYGNIVPEIIQVNGWHVNVRTLTEASDEKFATLNDQYGVKPSPETPYRVWL